MTTRTPAEASRLLDKMLEGARMNPKGFRSAAQGKHAKGHLPKKTTVEKLARVAFGEKDNG